MASRDQITAPVDAATKRAITQFQETNDHETQADAIRTLVEIGLRESTNPLVYRLKDRVVDWVSLLGIAAVIVFLTGVATTVIHVSDAAKLSISLLGAALILLGIYELTRVALGMNRLGNVIRSVLGGTQ